MADDKKPPPLLFEGQIASKETRLTSRTLLMLGGFVSYATLFGIPISKMPVLKQLFNDGQKLEIYGALALTLLLLMIAHYMNWRGDKFRLDELVVRTLQPTLHNFSTRLKEDFERTSDGEMALSMAKLMEEKQNEDRYNSYVVGSFYDNLVRDKSVTEGYKKHLSDVLHHWHFALPMTAAISGFLCVSLPLLV
ncbi:MAG: hypothetical protein ACRBCJ_15005, partial [Hyphomicrobiaceae bacterium]